MSAHRLTLNLLPDVFAVCQLNRDAALPAWALDGEFFSLTRTADELSIVCRQANVPEGVKCEKDWRGLRVAGTLDFSLTGILASLAMTLAEAEISIFAIATFDTDYLLIKADRLENAIEVLSAAGHRVTI